MLFEINAVSPRNFSTRKQWLQNVLDEAVDKENSTLSDMNLNSRAAALMLEAMRVFCVGNWISTLIVSQATIDAALWGEDKLHGINTNKLRTDADYVWLRNRRNTILHLVCGLQGVRKSSSCSHFIHACQQRSSRLYLSLHRPGRGR